MNDHDKRSIETADCHAARLCAALYAVPESILNGLCGRYGT